VTFGATGQTFVKGDTYEITDELMEGYPEYFKKSAGRPSNKQAGTDEDKSDGGDEAAEDAEATEATEDAE
jgi:hypothetical protein